MGSYKWSYKSPNIGYNYSYPTYLTLLITTHEPPSSVHIPKPRTEGLTTSAEAASSNSEKAGGLTLNRA